MSIAAVRVWEVKSGKEVFKTFADGTADTVAFSPNGKQLAIGGTLPDRADHNGVLEIWNLDPHLDLPDDEIEILGSEERGGTVVARYAWRRNGGKQAGELRLTPRGGEIAQLVVTFG